MYHICDVMISVLASSVIDSWYLLLLRYVRSIKEKEQRLVGLESG
jgi:hypothetical protein